MVAIVDVVVRIKIVVPHALPDPEGSGNRAAVALHHVVLDSRQLRHVGVGVRRLKRVPNPYSHGSDVVKRAVLNPVAGDHCVDIGGHAVGGDDGLMHGINSSPDPEVWVTVPASNVMCCEFWKDTAAAMSGSNSEDTCPVAGKV